MMLWKTRPHRPPRRRRLRLHPVVTICFLFTVATVVCFNLILISTWHLSWHGLYQFAFIFFGLDVDGYPLFGRDDHSSLLRISDSEMRVERLSSPPSTTVTPLNPASATVAVVVVLDVEDLPRAAGFQTDWVIWISSLLNCDVPDRRYDIYLVVAGTSHLIGDELCEPATDNCTLAVVEWSVADLLRRRCASDLADKSGGGSPDDVEAWVVRAKVGGTESLEFPSERMKTTTAAVVDVVRTVFILAGKIAISRLEGMLRECDGPCLFADCAHSFRDIDLKVLL